jgi:hypothetical protein
LFVNPADHVNALSEASTHVWRIPGPPDQCQGVTVPGDGAYINTGLIVPC